MNENLTGLRGVQIVSALREHGPLSIKTLVSFLEPPASRKRLARAMKRLADQGIVRRHFGSLPANAGHYYALNGGRESIRKVGKLLGIEPQNVKTAFIHGSELKHSEQCARWAEFLKKSFPEAKVVRDWEWKNDETFAQNFLEESGNRDLLPDVIVVFPKSSQSPEIQIGVEIERSKKCPERLVRKVDGILYRTLLDGVIYVCEQFEVAEGVRRAFLKGALEKSRRVGRYAKNFVLFSRYDACVEMLELSGVNLALETREIRNWIDSMKAAEQHMRENSLFDKGGLLAPR